MKRDEVTETYFDTAGLRLYTNGITLYRAVGGDEPGWHLDLGEGSVSLEPTPGLVSVPHDLRWLVTAFTRRADLEPVAEAVVHRDNDLEAVAVTLTSLRDGKCRDSEEPRATTRVARLARVLGPRRHRSHRMLTGRDLVLRYLRTEVSALPFADCAVRRELPGAVERLHEAASRIRSVLRHCAPLTGGKKLTRNIRSELRWFLSALAPSRDDDVQRIRLLRRLGEVPRDLGLGDASSVIDRYFTARAEENRAEVVEALDSARYLNLVHALDLLVVVLDEEPECARPPIARLPADVAFRNLTTAAGLEVDRRIGELADAEEPGTRASAVHRALKAVRRFECLLAVSDQDSQVRAWRRLLEEHRAADLAMRHLDALSRAAEEEGIRSPLFALLRRFEADAADRSAADLAWRWREGVLSSVPSGLEGRSPSSSVANGRGADTAARLTV